MQTLGEKRLGQNPTTQGRGSGVLNRHSPDILNRELNLLHAQKRKWKKKDRLLVTLWKTNGEQTSEHRINP